MVPGPRIDDKDVLSDSNDEAYKFWKEPKPNTTVSIRKQAHRFIQAHAGATESRIECQEWTDKAIN